MDEAVPATGGREEPKWLAPLSYLAALPVGGALLLSRTEPWTRVSATGFVLATCFSVGVVYLSAKCALKLPLRRTDEQLAIGGDWRDQRWGFVLQLIALASASAAMALL